MDGPVAVTFIAFALGRGLTRLYLAPEHLTGASVSVTGDGHRHLARVLRLTVGDPVVVFDGCHREIDARIQQVSADATWLELGTRRQLPPAPVTITLLQALSRGDRMDVTVQKTTELGVARIIPVVAGRSVPRFDGPTGEHKRDRWWTIAMEAARQCGRADIPTLTAPQTLAQALDLVSPQARRLVLWEGLPRVPLRAQLEPRAAEVALLVGPEGGFTQVEVDQAVRAGFTASGLGPRILRTETAAMIAVALVMAAAGGLD